MAVTKCNISFKVDYTSSTPLTGATASYAISGSGNPPVIHNITPLPTSNSLVTLPDILIPGNYDLTVKLTTAQGFVTKTETNAFKIGDCNPSSCQTPVINTVNVLSSGQIRMDYSVVTTNLGSPEYQIATDINFTNIVHSRVGFAYTQIENINMNSGNIPNDTVLYIRVRKHCTSPTATSNWSNVVQFTSKKWSIQLAPYKFNPACCVSGKFTSPKDISQLGSSICLTGNQWTQNVNLTTSTPQVGTQIYLSDGVTPAIPGNLSSFEPTTPYGFNQNGIRWVRFSNYNGGTIYDVNPLTGVITGISPSFDCLSV
jgi:hypothetical protein